MASLNIIPTQDTPLAQAELMIRFKLAPALSLALTLAITSILAAAQPFLGMANLSQPVAQVTQIAPSGAIAIPLHPSLLSQVSGNLASVWMSPEIRHQGALIAQGSGSDPIRDALGCSCAICTGQSQIEV
ncbi:hypothetical protein [Laspinema olomoucense]|nr:hypothetical protein [Laspinema sp. D3d]